MTDMLIVDLTPGRWTTCSACGDDTPVGQGLPVDDTGEFVDNDYQGEWSGVPACRRCFDVHAAGGVAALEAMLAHLPPKRDDDDD